MADRHLRHAGLRDRTCVRSRGHLVVQRQVILQVRVIGRGADGDREMLRLRRRIVATEALGNRHFVADQHRAVVRYGGNSLGRRTGNKVDRSRGTRVRCGCLLLFGADCVGDAIRIDAHGEDDARRLTRLQASDVPPVHGARRSAQRRNAGAYVRAVDGGARDSHAREVDLALATIYEVACDANVLEGVGGVTSRGYNHGVRRRSAGADERIPVDHSGAAVDGEALCGPKCGIVPRRIIRRRGGDLVSQASWVKRGTAVGATRTASAAITKTSSRSIRRMHLIAHAPLRSMRRTAICPARCASRRG